MNDELYMNIAIKEAKKGLKKEEIPVGAVIVKNGEVIAKSHNKRHRSNQVIDHAEIIAIKKANKVMNNWRLEDCEIYITLEPCPMCASAIEQARIKRVITGAINKNEESRKITNEILKKREREFEVRKEESTILLDAFFKEKR